jgi:3D (Asp-Asp-Asp) domain-containing protein
MSKSIKNKLIKNIILLSFVGVGLVLLLGLGLLISHNSREEVTEKQVKKAEKKVTSIDDSKNQQYISTLKRVSHKKKLKKLSEKQRRVMKKAVVVSRSKPKPQYEKMTVEATAYLPDCEGCIGITKSGYNVKHTEYYRGMRVAACDNGVLPMFTVFVSDQLKDKMICLDTGGGIKNFEIDILTHSREWALEWGRRDIEITILRRGRG